MNWECKLQLSFGKLSYRIECSDFCNNDRVSTCTIIARTKDYFKIYADNDRNEGGGVTNTKKDNGLGLVNGFSKT